MLSQSPCLKPRPSCEESPDPAFYSVCSTAAQGLLTGAMFTTHMEIHSLSFTTQPCQHTDSRDRRVLGNTYLCLGERCVQFLVFDLWFHCPPPPPVSSTDHTTSTRAQDHLSFVSWSPEAPYLQRTVSSILSCPQEGES